MAHGPLTALTGRADQGWKAAAIGYHRDVETFTGYRNEVLRYLAILKSARDFGLSHDEVSAIAGRFDPRETRCDELAEALGDLILARAPVAL